MSTFRQRVDTWVCGLTNWERRDIRDAGFWILITFMHIALRPDMLRSMAQFWNLETHVFQLENIEFSRLPEEFSAILGWPAHDVPYIPILGPVSVMEFANYFSLIPELVKALMVGEDPRTERPENIGLPHKKGPDGLASHY